MTTLHIPVEPRILNLTDAAIESLMVGCLTPESLRDAMTTAYRNGWVTGKLKGLDQGLHEIEGLRR